MTDEQRTFICSIPRISDEEFEYTATTAGKARYKCLLQAWDAGYERHDRRPSPMYPQGTLGISFRDVRVRVAVQRRRRR